MKRRSDFSSILITVSVSLLAGCSQFGGGIRRDFMTAEMAQPTMGGRWSERGVLADEEEENSQEPQLRGGMYGAIAHRDRRPSGALQTLSGNQQEEQDGRLVSRQGLRSQQPLNPSTQDGGTRKRARREDFQDRNSNEGSLWASDGQTNYYFTKNKIRGIGDIVTVSTEEPMIKDLAREVLRSLNDEELKEELSLAQLRLAQSPNLGATAGRQPAGTPGATAPANVTNQAPAEGTPSAPEIKEATFADIDVGKSLSIAAGEGIMAEIVERYPNGNYKVRGTKRVPYRNGYKLVTLTAIAKATDITEDDQLTSGKLYEYRIDVDQ